MLKWCEVKCRDSYHSFREGGHPGRAEPTALLLELQATRAAVLAWAATALGNRGPGCRDPGGHPHVQEFVTPGEQLLYQLPNNKVLTTKIGLLSALREYSRIMNKTNKTALCAQARYATLAPWAPTTSPPSPQTPPTPSTQQHTTHLMWRLHS